MILEDIALVFWSGLWICFFVYELTRIIGRRYPKVGQFPLKDLFHEIRISKFRITFERFNKTPAKMMHFQVSPPKRIPQNQESSNQIDHRTSTPSYLILGPHAKVPKIHFNEVKLGKSKKEILIIRNPTDTYVNLKFVKKPCNDFAFSCDLDAIITIPAAEQTGIEINWTPSKEGHFFEACQLVNSLNGIKLSVHLLGICASPPPVFKSRGLPKRRPLLGPPQSLNMIKPTTSFKPSQLQKSAPISIPPIKSSAKFEPLKTPPRSSALESIENMSFPFTPEPPTRRETFNVEKENTTALQTDEQTDKVDESFKHGQDLARNMPVTFSSTNNSFELENEFGKNCNQLIPVAESTRREVSNVVAITPLKTSPQLIDFVYPGTPEDRRATFVVGKEESGSARTSITGTITIFDDEDARIRDDIDEGMAELENLENLVLGFVNSF